MTARRILLAYLFFLALLMLFFGPSCQTHTPVPTPAPAPAPAPPPAPPTVLPLHNEQGHFADSSGQRWYWRGATDFQLLKYELEGTPYDQVLDQRQAAGANLVRVFGMAKNLFELVPSHYDYWAGVDRLLTKLEKRGMYVELVAFADALLLPPYDNFQFQMGHWSGFSRFAGRRNLFLELVNENSHAGNTINANAFPPIDGVMCAHGSEQTDQHPIEPHWNYVVYHARREGPPDARGATNYDPYEFEAGYPKDRPWVADEGIKTTDPGFALLMGLHARVGDGGTFHSQSGVTSQLWTPEEFEAAKAFYGGIGQ